MYFNFKDSSLEKSSKCTANIPRNQSHKKSLSNIPKAYKGNIIEIEETPLNSIKYLQNCTKLEPSINKKRIIQYKNNPSKQSIVDKVPHPKPENLNLKNIYKKIKIEENFSSERESIHGNNNFNKDFIYKNISFKTRQDLTGSFSKKNDEIKISTQNTARIHNLNKVKKSIINKNWESNNYMNNKIINFSVEKPIKLKDTNSSYKEVEKKYDNNNKTNNTALSSKISNTINTNFNNNETFEQDKESYINLSSLNNIATNNEKNNYNNTEYKGEVKTSSKDQYNMFFNNYILTNQSKLADENSITYENKNQKNILGNRNDKNHNSEKYNNTNIYEKSSSRSFNKNEFSNQINANLRDKIEYSERNKENLYLFNSRHEKNHKPIRIIENNCNDSKTTINLKTDESFKLNKEAILIKSINANNSINVNDITIKNKTSLLNSIDDLNFTIENRGNLCPQNIENSIIYDLASKYSGVSLKKIDYRTLKKQHYIDAGKSITILFFRF